jgi:hypothetical protein
MTEFLTVCEWLECRVQEEKPSTSFTFAGSVTIPEVKRSATRFPSRILSFLRCLCFLFQDETDKMHPNFAQADRRSSEVKGAVIEVHRVMAQDCRRASTSGVQLP